MLWRAVSFVVVCCVECCGMLCVVLSVLVCCVLWSVVLSVVVCFLSVVHLFIYLFSFIQ